MRCRRRAAASARGRACRRTSPQRRRREPAAREHLARRSASPRAARRAGSRSSGTSAASARAARRAGAGARPGRGVAPQPAPSIICSSEPATPGIETSRAAWARPRSATSTSASPSCAACPGSRSCSERQERRVRSCTGPRGERGHAARRPAARRPPAAGLGDTPVQEADSAGAWPSVRCPPTTRRRAGRPPRRCPSSTCSACSRSGLTSMSTSAERAAAHRAHVGHVGDDRGGAGAERVGRDERRRRSPRRRPRGSSPRVRDQRGVVAVDLPAARARPAARSRLPSSPGAFADGGGERGEVGHRDGIERMDVRATPSRR